MTRPLSRPTRTIRSRIRTLFSNYFVGTTSTGKYSTHHFLPFDDVNNDRPTPFSSRARHAVTALTVSSEVSTCRPLIYCCGMWTDGYVACGGILILSIFFNVRIQLCEYAQSWANHLAQSNEFYYRSDKTIGQNLFCCPVSALVTDLTGKWD